MCLIFSAAISTFRSVSFLLEYIHVSAYLSGLSLPLLFLDFLAFTACLYTRTLYITYMYHDIVCTCSFIFIYLFACVSV